MYGINENIPHPPTVPESMESCLNIPSQHDMVESIDKSGEHSSRCTQGSRILAGIFWQIPVVP